MRRWMLTGLVAAVLLAAGGCQWGGAIHNAQNALHQKTTATVDLLVTQGQAFREIAVDRGKKLQEALTKYDALSLAVQLDEMTGDDGQIKAPATQITKIVVDYVKRGQDQTAARYEFQKRLDAYGSALGYVSKANAVNAAKAEDLHKAMQDVSRAWDAALHGLVGAAASVGGVAAISGGL